MVLGLSGGQNGGVSDVGRFASRGRRELVVSSKHIRGDRFGGVDGRFRAVPNVSILTVKVINGCANCGTVVDSGRYSVW